MVFVGLERLHGRTTRPSAAATGTARPGSSTPTSCCPTRIANRRRHRPKERSAGSVATPGRRMRSAEPQWSRIMTDDADVTDDAHGQTWHLVTGDSCERLAEIPDDSVHLSVYSPRSSLFTYSPSPAETSTTPRPGGFIEHYGFIIRENLRVTIRVGSHASTRPATHHHEDHARVRWADRLPRPRSSGLRRRRMDLPR